MTSFKLSLHHFGEIGDHTLVFTPGLHLLSGPSGAGKSTIFKAMLFVLYGEVGVKPNRDGCKVTLEYDKMRIERTKRPDVVKVYPGIATKVMQDAEGQAFIDAKFGDKQAFMLSGYIPQRSWNSWFEANTSQKLAYLEHLLNKDAPDIERWLSQLQTIKQNLTSQYHQLTGQLAQLNQTKPSQSDTTDKKLTKSDREGYKQKIAEMEQMLQLEQKLRNEETERDRIRQSLETDLGCLGDITEIIALSQIESWRTELAQQKQYLANFAGYYRRYQLNGTSDNNVVVNYSPASLKQYHTQWADEAKLHQALPDIPRAEMAHVLETWLEWYKQATSYNQYVEIVTNLQTQLAQLPQVSLENALEQQITATIVDKVLPCPVCNANLQLKQGQLHAITGQVISPAEATKLKAERDKQVQLARQYQNLSQKYDDMCQHVPMLPDEAISPTLAQNALAPLLTLARKVPPPVSIDTITEQLASLNLKTELDRLPTLPENYDPTLTIEQIKTNINHLNQNITRAEQAKTNQVKREALIRQLANLAPIDSDRGARIDQLKQNLVNYKNTLSQAETELKFRQWQKQHQQITQSQTEHVEHLDAVSKLEDTIVLSEYLYIEQVLDKINVLLNPIVTKLFDEPISVTLSAFKTLKNNKRNKPTLHLSIAHNGSVKQDLREVSVGMADRISVAFTLTLAQLTNQQILLLDEVGVSLDAVIWEQYIDVLREYGPPVIIITQHGGVKGCFDNIITIHREN